MHQPTSLVRSIVLGALLALVLCAASCFDRAETPEELPVAAGPQAIHLKSRVFVPEPGIEPDFGAALEQAPEGLHGLIQLTDIPGAEQRNQLAERGVRLLEYIPETAWVAWLPAGAENLTELDWVRWIGALRPGDRVDPSLTEGEPTEWLLTSEGHARLWVMAFEDVPLDQAAVAVEARGGRVVERIPELRVLSVELPPDAILDLAAGDAVQWIEPLPGPGADDNDGLRKNLGVDPLQGTNYGLTGKNVTAGQWETGRPDPGHPDLKSRSNLKSRSSSTACANFPIKAHATRVAGVLAGNGANSNRQGGTKDQWRGVATGLNLESRCVQSSTRIASHETALQGSSPIHLSQNSWSPFDVKIEKYRDPACKVRGNYDLESRGYDRIVTGLYGARIPVIFSAGNDRRKSYLTACQKLANKVPGFEADPSGFRLLQAGGKSAKNTLTIGAIHSDDDKLYPFSNFGPTRDGRLKPELVAPGCETGGDKGIHSTTTGNTYATKCGTSYSAPAVSGTIALMLERNRDLCPKSKAPLPSTLRALLIHTARDLGAKRPGPDYVTGYGRVQAKEAIDLIPHHLEGQVGHKQQKDYRIVVSKQDELKVTLAWDDWPATTNARPALVNDLDLELIDPNGIVHRPWRLDPSKPGDQATRGIDRRNVIEQVVVAKPLKVLPGTWKIRVRGTRVPHAPQRYSLVSQHLAAGGCTGADATDVWIRDHGSDLGKPPSTGVVYMSPDIWVRTAKDDQTAHQNPVSGRSNYLYVEVRNRGTNTALNVRAQLYWAPSSTGLAWPRDWQLAGATTVANLGPGQSRRSDPIAWTPPAAGDYCLYARLLSAQDPLAPESANVDANTRRSNNIAWKNVTVVSPPPGLPQLPGAGFIVRNTSPEPAVIELVFRVPEDELGSSFLDRGEVIVDLGPELFERWQGAGARGTGFELLAGTAVRILDPAATVLSGIPLEPSAEHDVSIRFEVPAGDEVGASPTALVTSAIDEPRHLLVEQWAGDELIGGVAYVIRSRPDPLED